MGIEESKKKEKGDIIITLFPNLISLTFWGFDNWEEWNGIGGKEDCIRRFTIMPRLRELIFWDCPKLKSLLNFFCTAPLQNLKMDQCPILIVCCKRGIGEEWPKISHIPNNIEVTSSFILQYINIKLIKILLVCQNFPRHLN